MSDLSPETGAAVREAVGLLTAYLADGEDETRPTSLAMLDAAYERGGVDGLYRLVAGLQVVNAVTLGMLAEHLGVSEDDLLADIAEVTAESG